MRPEGEEERTRREQPGAACGVAGSSIDVLTSELSSADVGVAVGGALLFSPPLPLPRVEE